MCARYAKIFTRDKFIMRLFITGTGTDVGKTMISALLCYYLKADYWKPIQTGALDSNRVKALSGAKIHPETYHFPQAVSPHLAAMQNNTEIDLNKIIMPQSDHLIIEGAGGILAPLNKTQRVVDLITFLQTPVIVVASSGLGTINHTCLTLESLRARGIDVLGVILYGNLHRDNQAAIEHYANITVLAQVQPFTILNDEVCHQARFSEKLLGFIT